jgi:ribosome-associated protein
VSVRVNRSLEIPDDELEFTFSTSSGPGGQHANKAATRVDVAWNVAASRVLGPRQRDRIRSRLGRRIDSVGVLRLSSSRFRSQLRNRADVTERLAGLVAEALRPEKKRVVTRPTRASVERRLRAKKQRSATKQGRRARPDD